MDDRLEETRAIIQAALNADFGPGSGRIYCTVVGGFAGSHVREDRTAIVLMVALPGLQQLPELPNFDDPEWANLTEAEFDAKCDADLAMRDKIRPYTIVLAEAKGDLSELANRALKEGLPIVVEGELDPTIDPRSYEWGTSATEEWFHCTLTVKAERVSLLDRTRFQS